MHGPAANSEVYDQPLKKITAQRLSLTLLANILIFSIMLGVGWFTYGYAQLILLAPAVLLTVILPLMGKFETPEKKAEIVSDWYYGQYNYLIKERSAGAQLGVFILFMAGIFVFPELLMGCLVSLFILGAVDYFAFEKYNLFSAYPKLKQLMAILIGSFVTALTLNLRIGIPFASGHSKLFMEIYFNSTHSFFEVGLITDITILFVGALIFWTVATHILKPDNLIKCAESGGVDPTEWDGSIPTEPNEAFIREWANHLNTQWPDRPPTKEPDPLHEEANQSARSPEVLVEGKTNNGG